MRAKIAGSWDHGSSSGLNPGNSGGSTDANVDTILEPANTPVQATSPAAPRPFIRSRLFIIFIIILYFLDFTSKLFVSSIEPQDPIHPNRQGSWQLGIS